MGLACKLELTLGVILRPRTSWFNPLQKLWRKPNSKIDGPRWSCIWSQGPVRTRFSNWVINHKNGIHVEFWHKIASPYSYSFHEEHMVKIWVQVGVLVENPWLNRWSNLSEHRLEFWPFLPQISMKSSCSCCNRILRDKANFC